MYKPFQTIIPFGNGDSCYFSTRSKMLLQSTPDLHHIKNLAQHKGKETKRLENRITPTKTHLMFITTLVKPANIYSLASLRSKTPLVCVPTFAENLDIRGKDYTTYILWTNFDTGEKHLVSLAIPAIWRIGSSFSSKIKPDFTTQQFFAIQFLNSLLHRRTQGWM